MTRVYHALMRSGEEQADMVLEAIGNEEAENARVLGQPLTGVLRDGHTAAAMPPEVPDILPESRQTPPPMSSTPASTLMAGYRQIAVDITSNPLLFPFEGSDRAAADQYRVLRTNLVHHPARPSLIAVSSATPGDGKTLTAVNTAGILAWKNEGDVLLIDADLRRRSVAPLLGIPQEPGFADVLQARCTIDEAIANVPAVPRLHALTAGTPSVNPAELLDSAACRDILAMVRGRFRYVVVDTAPIGVLTDFDLVQPCCDGVVVVVRPDHTNRKLLNQALSHMPADAVLGVVLNGYQDWLLSVSPASYAYAYERK